MSLLEPQILDGDKSQTNQDSRRMFSPSEIRTRDFGSEKKTDERVE